MNLKVMMDGEEVGRLRYDSDTAFFAYSDHWLREGFPISPRSLPLEDRLFSGRSDRFEGLFGVFADSLPGGWGMLTAVKALGRRGISYFSLDPLEKLSYVGADGLGALYYEPSERPFWEPGEPDLDRLCDECMSLSVESSGDLDEIFMRAGSTGGARPKINLRIDGEDWIVKFRERSDPISAGRMEYEYTQTAKECGIEVPETRLLDSSTSDGYFASRRFDRQGGRRVHMLSLGGLLEVPGDMPLLDYLTFLQATRYVTGSQEETVKAFRLSCFNILAKNFDDHSKNFAYLYSRDKGRYVLSPAYDLTGTPSMAEHFMTCMGNPLPGEKELFGLADASGIPRNRAEDIIRTVADNVSERLAEWL